MKERDRKRREVDERLDPRPQCVHRKADEERRADRHRGDDLDVPEASVSAGLGQAVDHRGKPRRQQRQSEHVERVVAALLRRRHVTPGQQQGDRADGYVDEEDPAPAEAVEDQAADHRPHDRGDERGHGDGRCEPAQPTRPGRLGHDRLEQRKRHAPADALHHPERDQAPGRPGKATQDGAAQKQRERQHPHSLASEAVHRPPGDRYHHREGEQVAGRDPLDRRQARVQLAPQSADRDVDDRYVELDGGRPDQHDARELQQRRVEPVRILGNRCVGAHERRPSGG